MRQVAVVGWLSNILDLFILLYIYRHPGRQTACSAGRQAGTQPGTRARRQAARRHSLPGAQSARHACRGTQARSQRPRRTPPVGSTRCADRALSRCGGGRSAAAGRLAGGAWRPDPRPDATAAAEKILRAACKRPRRAHAPTCGRIRVRERRCTHPRPGWGGHARAHRGARAVFLS